MRLASSLTRATSSLISRSDRPLAGSSNNSIVGSEFKARERRSLLDGIGQGRRIAPGVLADAELVEQRLGRAREAQLFTARTPDAEHRRGEVGVKARLGTEHHVLENRQPLAEPDALHGAGDTELGEIVGTMP